MIDYVEYEKIGDRFKTQKETSNITINYLLEKIYYYIFESPKIKELTSSSPNKNNNGSNLYRDNERKSFTSKSLITKLGPKPNNFKLETLENFNTPTPNVTYDYFVTVVDKSNSPDQSYVVDVGEKVRLMKEHGGVI